MTVLTNIIMSSWASNAVLTNHFHASLVFRQKHLIVFMAMIYCILPISANAVVLHALPDSEYADTEVSTNAFAKLEPSQSHRPWNRRPERANHGHALQ